MRVYSSAGDVYFRVGDNDALHTAIINSNYAGGNNTTTHFVQIVGGSSHFFIQLKYNYNDPVISMIQYTYFHNGYGSASDRRLKRDIRDIDEEVSMNAINSLHPITYNYCYDDEDKTPRHGLIAQDVEEVLPDLVSETLMPGYEEKKYKCLEYTGLIPHLINCVKVLTRRVNQQQALIEDLLQRLN